MMNDTNLGVRAAEAKGRSSRAADVAFLAVLIVIGAWLRLYRLETGLWFDEIATLLDSVRHPLSQIITHFPSNNDHPLYSVLAHLAVSAFGDEPWALRVPAALFGVAAIPLLYVLGTSVTSRLEAGAAALMLTFSYHHIWFSQNARGYTLLLVCVMLATVALIRWLATGRTSFLLLYAVAIALGAYAHLTMVLVCLAHALVCVIDCQVHGTTTRTRIHWKALTGTFVGAGALTGVLYAPMLWDVGEFFATSSTAGPAAQIATPLWAALAALRGLQAGFGQLWAIALGGLVFGAGVWSYFRQRSTVALLFLLPVPATLLVMVAMHRPVRPRFVFFAIGIGLLFTVRGATWIGARLAPLAAGRLTVRQCTTAMVAILTVAVVALSIRSLPYGYRFPKQDYEQAVRFVEQRKGDGIAAAVAVTSAMPVLEYLRRPWQRVDDASQLRALRDTGASVWVIYTFPSYIEVDQPELWAVLQTDCTEVREFEGTVEGGNITVRHCP